MNAATIVRMLSAAVILTQAAQIYGGPNLFCIDSHPHLRDRNGAQWGFICSTP